MRKLASIQRILALEAIEGADAIEKATVLGWQLVVKKGEFRVGDLCVYCEIDSLFPDKPEFEFLRPRGMRIKTIRLRGQVSQGICFPLEILPEGTLIEEDADVTDALEITKWELPVPVHLSGTVKGSFPSFIPKTDETRVQVLQHLLDELAGTVCYVTEKLDGSSATFYLKDGEFGACSRNLELREEPGNGFWMVARLLDIENKLRSTGRNLALQGELLGPGVNGNKLKIKEITVRFFNAFDIDRFKYFSFGELKQLLTDLDLPMVPVLEDDFVLIADIPKLVEKATIRSTVSPEIWAEGIVIRPLEEQFLRQERVSFKAINPEFLIKFGE